MSSYFDTLYLQLKQLPSLKDVQYVSSSIGATGSYKPLPFSERVLSHSDSILAEVGGIVGVDCSWNMAEATFSKLKLMGLEPRRLPDVIPANPVNSGKIGKLTTAEAIASALMLCHQKEQAVEIMSIFKWGPAFLEMNSSIWK